MDELPEGARKLIEGTNLAHFVTLMKDGSPQVTPVWVDHDGEYVLINTAEGRQKTRNLDRDARVAVSIVDNADAFHTLQVRGHIVERITGEPAWDSIDKLALKYRGSSSSERRTRAEAPQTGAASGSYPRRPGEERVLFKIAPDHVSYRAGR